MSVQSITMPFPARLKTPVKFDAMFLLIVATLLLGGFIVLASASTAISTSAGGSPFHYLIRQLVAAVIGLIAAGVCLFVPMDWWRRLGPLLLLAGLALLLIVLIPQFGHSVNGSRRWIDLGFMKLQASEPARLCFIIYIAGYLVRRSRDVQENLTGFLKPILIMSFAAAALLAEPDFGAALVLLTTVMTMLFVAGARVRDFVMMIILGGIAFAALALSSEYRLRRLTGFMDPWADPFNSGFQLTQSLIAIGRGEWFGVGLGNSVQKLFYLPEAHTDFVFAVFAEEFGLVGSAIVILLFGALVWRIALLAKRAVAAERFFEAYVAVGIGTWLGIQAFINLGVNMGMLPTKGLTLPLISYGRSSLIMTLVTIGILMRIHHELSVDAKPVNKRKRRKTQ